MNIFCLFGCVVGYWFCMFIYVFLLYVFICEDSVFFYYNIFVKWGVRICWFFYFDLFDFLMKGG